ncbi:MAG: hypothetical protein MK185_03425 [Saccharospirillaceae bacterium]|nr:hypothetical protein [Saccharospirillaceae bacterium]
MNKEHPVSEESELLKTDLDAFGNVLRRAFNLREEFKKIYWDDGRVQLINDHELNFFKMLFDELYGHLIILACKMTDNGESGRNGINKNLTLDYFLRSECVESHSRYSEIKNIYDQQIKPARSELLVVRNKYLAHQDLSFFREKEKYLPGFKYVDDVVDGVNKVYRLLSVIVNDHDILRAPMKCGAPYVFHLLEKALQD